MKTNRRPGKYRKKTAQRGLLLFLAVMLCISAGLFGIMLRYAIVSQRQFRELSAQVHAAQTTQTAASTTQAQEPTAAQETAPTVQTAPQILAQYQQLYEENAELFGWLSIPDTVIDYPVMHTPDDPEKYLHADFNGEYSFAGTPFVDAKCSLDSDNLLIYAHNMLDGSMFRSLLNYQEVTYWQEHPSIYFSTLYEEGEYEVLAAFYDRVYYKTETVFKFYQFIDAADEAEFDEAIAQFQEKSLYDTGVTAAYGDKLITLVTCAYHTDNGRFVVVARKK